MLYMEEVLDAVIAEEGQTLMGLDFLIDTLNLPMNKIDLLFRKALAEYSERRPMKKTSVIVDEMNEMLVITKAFYKKACVFGSAEYYELRKAREETGYEI